MPVANSIAAASAELRAWRQDFHMHPELGYEEHRTAQTIAEKLREFGFDAVEEGIGGTGLVGVLHGRNGPGDEAHSIMLRADMDALPMEELNEVPHRSQVSGKMHACGHDGHVTMLLGGAQNLAQTRNFDGTVYFCFQPAEEGGAGAHAMMQDGLFERFPCRAVYGMHNWPGHPVGRFLTRPGPLLAASDEFLITIEGAGGHAAQPHLCKDPVVCAAAIIQALQAIISRESNPVEAAVITVTTVEVGKAFNVIAEHATLGGTVRSFDDTKHDGIYEAIRRTVEHVAMAYGMTATLNRRPGYYPATVNDPAETDFCVAVAQELAGADSVVGDIPPTMGGEDFAFFARAKPCCFMLCGNGDTAGLHHPRYDFDDTALPWGASYWALLTERALPLA